MPTYPDDYIGCTICPALAAELCYERSTGGPDALPEVRSDVPHSSRPLSATVAPRKSPVRKPTATPVRRRAARSATTAASWQALADKRRRNA